MIRSIRRALAVFAIMLGMMVAQSGLAQAAKVWPIERANPGLSKNVVNSLPNIVKNSSVKVAKDFVPGTPIIYPDGTLVPGQSTDAIAAAAACSEYAYSAVTGTWGPVVTSCYSLFGSPGLQVPYKWQASTPPPPAKGVVRVRGFTSGGAEYWKSNGSNVTYEVIVITVNWGNVLASFKAQGYKITGDVFTAKFWHL